MTLSFSEHNTYECIIVFNVFYQESIFGMLLMRPILLVPFFKSKFQFRNTKISCIIYIVCLVTKLQCNP